ncbi:MAG TPA: hypothetical protein ENL07_02175 [Chlorobaculum parvum]|uniref:Uncharacterized protein n=1 Tax=Chlorobaculum parvum TaxID=274539 RepID=A0A7C5HB77_9CHLB|nr:hypothetical protein [Chlorobaculum parvum]
MEPDNTSPFFYCCRARASRNETDTGAECARTYTSGKSTCSDESGNACDRHDSSDLPERGSSTGRSDSE